MKKLYSVTDYANKLGTSRFVILWRIKQGYLPAFKVGNNWVIDQDDADIVPVRKWNRKEK